MYINFSEQLAIDFDLEVEYFLRNLVYWLCFNAAKDNPEHRNLREGLYWSYNSYSEYAKLIPVLTQKQIRTVAARAIKGGLLQVNNFNHKKYDNTNWYTLTEKGWTYFDREARKLYPHWFVDINKPEPELNTSAQMGRHLCPNGQTYTNTSTSLRENTTNSSSNSKSKEKNLNLMRDMIEVYREEFPNNPQPHPRVVATSLQKTLQTLIKKWPELDPDGKPLTRVTFQRYLNLLRTTAPKFSLGEYETHNGNRKKNSLETFARWNTVVKFLENQYS